nr:hypothetical protein [Tanacetum cinerariifolium]
KCEAVDEEEAEDDDNAGQDAPPKPLVHSSLYVLLALHKILHRKVQRVQCPDVESGQRGRQGQNDKQNKGTSIVRANSERCNG